MNKLLLVLENTQEWSSRTQMLEAAKRCQDQANRFLASGQSDAFVIVLGDGVRLARAFQVGDVPIQEITVKVAAEAREEPPPAGNEEGCEALRDLGLTPAPLGTTGMTCVVCEQPLGIPDGYGETGMCGPCATGESGTLEERGETW